MRAQKTIGGALLAALFVGTFAGCEGDDEAPASLVIHAAAVLRRPLEQIAARYEAQTGERLELHFGGSGTLLGNLEMRAPDLYFPADESYLELASARGWEIDALPLAELRAGFLAAEGNPLGLSQLSDLSRKDVRMGIANPEASAVGKVTQEVLRDHGYWEAFEPTALFPTVTELANATHLGALDAAIVWDVLARQYPTLEFVVVPEFAAEPKQVAVGVLRGSAEYERAFAFARYLALPDGGLRVFEEEGYRVTTDRQGNETGRDPGEGGGNPLAVREARPTFGR